MLRVFWECLWPDRYAAEGPEESEEDTAASEDFEDAESASEALDEFTDVDPTVP